MKIRQLLHEGRADDLIKQAAQSIENKYTNHEDFEKVKELTGRVMRNWSTLRKGPVFSTFPNTWKIYVAQEAKTVLNYKIATVIEKKNVPVVDIGKVQDVIYFFSHLIGIPYPKIQNFNPLESSAPLVELRNLEDEFKKLSADRGVRPQEGDNELLSFGKYKWVMLNRGSCETEAEAMGHCGNIGSAKPHDRIISFRKVVEIDGDEYHKPHLTFIYNDGSLGEMKGRGNDKPTEKYHKYIVELLKLPIIKSMEGGGYLEENNFKLSDLSESYIEELRQARGQEFIDLQMIFEDPEAIIDMNDPSEELQLAAIKKDAQLILKISEPTETVQKMAIYQNSFIFKYMTRIPMLKMSDDVKLFAVKQNIDNITYIKNPTEEMQLVIVQQDLFYIRTIENPSENIQLAAIKKHKNVIRFFKNPTEKAKQLQQELWGG